VSSFRASLPERHREEKDLQASWMKRRPKRCKPTTQVTRPMPEDERAIELPSRSLATGPQASELLLLDRFDHPETVPTLLISAWPFIDRVIDA